MKRIYKRTFYYKYSFSQKLFLIIPILSLMILMLYPLNQQEAKFGTILLFLFSLVSLYIVLQKKNSIEWDLNSITLKVQGNDKVFLNKDEIDQYKLVNEKLIISFYNQNTIELNLEKLRNNEKDLFFRTFISALKETEKTEILFHNHNKMSLIYKDDI